MALVDGAQISCGVSQLYGLDPHPEDTLISLGESIFFEGATTAFVTWSDIRGRKQNGEKLYQYIKRHFPKSNVVKTKSAKNPNSRNNIHMYIWRIPKRDFKKWFNIWDVEKPYWLDSQPGWW